MNIYVAVVEGGSHDEYTCRVVAASTNRKKVEGIAQAHMGRLLRRLWTTDIVAEEFKILEFEPDDPGKSRVVREHP